MASIEEFYGLMDRLVYKKETYSFEDKDDTVTNNEEIIQVADNDEFSVDLSGVNVTEAYFDNFDWAAQNIVTFFDNHLVNSDVHKAFYDVLVGPRRRNYDDMKFCLLIDIERCYVGLNHSTSPNTPEGIALLLLLTRLFMPQKLFGYAGLNQVPESVINLDAIVAYASMGSEEIDIPADELVIARLLAEVKPNSEVLYRKVIYRFCEAISEVDGTVSRSEDEFLKAILRLDDDPDNDIEM